MNIGNKVKALRLAKMLTQSELAGDEITRNMLSRIENGSALPSLQTLMYLADKLGVPAGYLLAEETEDFEYKKLIGMPDIIRAFKDGDWRICTDLCEKLGGTDDETAHIVSVCRFNEAKEAFDSGELRAAVALFDEARSISQKTVYADKSIAPVCDAYLYCIGSISPLLIADIEVARLPSVYALADDFCRYFVALRATSRSGAPQTDLSSIIAAESDNGIFADHINARLKMRSGCHGEAYRILKGLLASDGRISAPMLYFVFSDLEACCRELSDYKGAYDYSSDKTGMLEKFLG